MFITTSISFKLVTFFLASSIGFAENNTVFDTDITQTRSQIVTNSTLGTGSFAVDIKREDESTTLKLTGFTHSPNIENPVHSNATPTVITLVYKPSGFNFRVADEVIFVSDETTTVVFRTEIIAPNAMIWSSTSHPGLGHIEVWNTDDQDTNLSPIDLAFLMDVLILPGALYETLTIQCDPPYGTCLRDATQKCKHGIKTFEYSCNQTTGTATCKWTCNPAPAPDLVPAPN